MTHPTPPGMGFVSRTGFWLTGYLLRKLGDGVRGYFAQTHVDAVTKEMRDALCANQGHIAAYYFVAGELHKKVREALNCDNPDPKALAAAMKELNLYLNSTLKSVSLANFTAIKKVVGENKHDKATALRVCLKMQRECPNNGKEIIDLFRDTAVPYNSCCMVQHNSAAQEVLKNAEAYTRNNIPEEAKLQNYHNHRLEMKRVRDYSPKIVDGLDEGWRECWKSNDGVLPPLRSCYKSTLVIPVTFTNNHQLDDSCSNTFSCKHSLLQAPPQPGTPEVPSQDAYTKLMRLRIHALLCLDHPETGYFNRSDINIGYMFSDILSLYFWARDMYVLFSGTYQNTKAALEAARIPEKDYL